MARHRHRGEHRGRHHTDPDVGLPPDQISDLAPGLLATIGVSIVCYLLANPVPGLGIAEPVFVPSLAAATAALLLSRRHAAPLAYIGGSLGTLIGADLLNLGKVQGLGAPVASIGGAGTFDGIFLIGILAVLIASLTGGADSANPSPARQAL
jgi:uncharacterized membrane protein